MDRFTYDRGSASAVDEELNDGAFIEDVTSFGSNPGALRMNISVPRGRQRMKPLVVVLHGCTQTPRGFDRASGWSRLAWDHDFLVLFPEQRPTNNEKSCFSWFQPDDVRRGCGEAESIRQMIAKAVADYGADSRRVFVCGLSAGGAMSCAMLAAYPEVFAGGSIIAGLAYGAARNTSEALDIMFVGRVKEARIWGDLVRAASPHTGPWPQISVWHGTADNVVKPINAGELVKQWTNVHGVGDALPHETRADRLTKRTWRNKAGRICVTHYCVDRLGHGVPVADRSPPAPFFIPAGVSATDIIARDFGLI